jgi:hypothetical protein
VIDSTFVTVRASSAQDASIYSEATIVLHNYTDSLICFSRDILPILSGSCGTSGCHDAATHKGNYNAQTYEGTLAVVKPGDARSSRLYIRLIDFNATSRMPPPPQTALPQMQIMKIGQWIDQGAIDCQ